MTTNRQHDFNALSGGSQAGHGTSSGAPLRAPASSVLPDGSTQDDEVTFISGVASNGTVAGRSSSTWDSEGGPNGKGIDANGNGYYSTGASESFKWNGDNTSTSFTSTAGTTGGTLTYYFDPSANWTASEKTALTSGLDMWHQVANISFAETQSASTANVSFQRNTNNDAFFQATGYTKPAIGSSNLYHPGTGSVITFDTASGSYGAFGDYNNGGYGVQVVLHEEGHLLGLGHGGPYNGDKTPNQQFTAYDNRAYTIMSYFNPDDAKQYPSPVTTGYSGQNATTWMPLDIDAIQRLYGAQTSGQLNQRQTFGYNTTISGSLKPYFDFSSINTPVLTLYDTAASGNRLDLSGSSAASNVNMNPGTYSSTHGLTNNIAIYKNTYIQSAVTGAGNDTITVNLSQNNEIDGGTGGNTAVFAGNVSEYDYSFDSSTGVTTVTRSRSADTSVRPNGVVDTLKNVQTLQFSDTAVTVCYATGTRLRTVTGEVAVEALRVDDVVVTASGEHRPIRWIGHRTMACQGRKDVLPVRIAAGAFGQGRPARDLLVSPAHAICVDLFDEVLIPAIRLVNGTTITQIEADTVTYWHVELDSHDILLAEGLPAESYLECGNRRFFANAEVTDLAAVPDARPEGALPFCRPLHEDGPLVAFVRSRLEARARTLGWHRVEEAFAGLHVVADGKTILPRVTDLTARFVLPAGVRDVRLVSQTSVPAYVLPGTSDDRRLGVPLGALTIGDGEHGARTIPLDDAQLTTGFHALDGDGNGTSWRWTDGSAVLPASLWAGESGAVLLQVRLTGPALPRWVGPLEAVGIVEHRRRA